MAQSLVPEAFMKAHCLRLPGGEVAPEVAARLKEMLASPVRSRPRTNA